MLSPETAGAGGPLAGAVADGGMKCLLVPPADQCAVCSALGEKAGWWVGVEAGTTSHQPLVGGQQGCNVATGACAYLGSRAAEGLSLAAPRVPGDKPNFGDIGYGCPGTRGLSVWGWGRVVEASRRVCGGSDRFRPQGPVVSGFPGQGSVPMSRA